MDPAPAAASPTEGTGTAAAVSPPSSSLIFLGTGCSGALPDTRCLIKPSATPCAVCSTALSLPPDQNPNYRLNTSLLIDYCHDDGTHKHILIDCGKTFREQVLRWFVHHKVPSVDSIILTHDHADAVLGLDEVSVVQPSNGRNGFEQIPIFLTQFTMDSIARRFPYLLNQKPEDGDEVARAAQIEWKIIEGDIDKPFVASGLEFVPLPVMHGEGYICLGFLLGKMDRVAYLSDVSRFLPSTEHVVSCQLSEIILKGANHNSIPRLCCWILLIPACFIAPCHWNTALLTAAISKSGAGQLDLLILEANNLDPVGGDPRSTHLTLNESLDAIKRICPKRALLIGMRHMFEHHRENQMLAEWSRREGIPVQLAHDGLRIFIDL